MIGEMGCDMENTAVLSVGTGSAVRDLRNKTLKEIGGRRGWGMLEWILPNDGNIVNALMDGGSEASQAIVEIFFRVRTTWHVIVTDSDILYHTGSSKSLCSSCQ